MAYTHDTRDLTPVMTANNAPSPIVVSASSETYSPNYLAWNAFNHTGANSTYATNTVPSVNSPQWLKIDFGEGNEQYVGSYALSEDTANANSQPRDWTFEGSSNGTDWTILDTRSNEVSANWSSGTLRYFNCQKAGLFRYYRINCTANCGATNVYCISELELFDTRVNLCQTMTSNTAPAPYSAFASSGYSAGYEAYRSVDKSVSTKWASTNTSFPHWIAYYFGGDKYIFSGVGITGADYPSSATAKASPSTFKIQGSNDNVTYDDLASYTGVTNWTENITKYFSCKCSKSYRFIRIYVTANDGSVDNIVNIRELKVFGQLKDKCLTPVMTSNSAPSPYAITRIAEYAGLYAYMAFNRKIAIDGDMWLSQTSTTPVTHPYYLIMYLGGNLCKVTHVDIMGTTSAGYGCLKDFTIEGSIDNITYTVIGSFTNQTGSTGYVWTPYETRTFPVTVGYWKYIKVNVTATNPIALNQYNYGGIGEVMIYGEQFSNLCATMTSNSTPSPYTCSASSEYSASYRAYMTFRKNGSTDTWESSGNSGQIQYYFGGISYLFNNIVLMGDGFGLNRSAKDFTIEVSNDGINWVIVSTVANQTSWQTSERRLFTFKTYSGYKYLRLNITANDGGVRVGIDELEIYGRPAKQIVNGYPDITPAMTAASVPENYAVTATDNYSEMESYKAYNHVVGLQNTGWVDSNSTLPKYNQIKLANPIAFNRIDMVSSSDYPEDNPQDFEIYGSIDGSLYTLLAFFQGIIWGTSQETKTFRFNNDIPYNYCKINCLAIKSSRTAYYIKLNEVYISREERNDNFDI